VSDGVSDGVYWVCQMVCQWGCQMEATECQMGCHVESNECIKWGVRCELLGVSVGVSEGLLDGGYSVSDGVSFRV